MNKTVPAQVVVIALPARNLAFGREIVGRWLARILRGLLFGVGLSVVCPVWAGQVILQNEDVIAGEIMGIEGGMVIWQSDSLGQIRLPKSQVKSLASDTPLKIRGQEEPCFWIGMKGRKIRFQCGTGKKKLYSLMGLKHVVPFANHVQANYSYGGNLRVTGWKQTGNSHVEYQEVMTEVRLRHGDLRHEFNINHNSQKTTSFDYSNNLVFRSHLRRTLASYALNWYFLPRWYWANTVSVGQDDGRNIHKEYRASSGLGHLFWENSRSSLELEAGLQYNRTYLEQNLPDVRPDTYPAMRLATNFRYKLKSGQSFYHKNQFNHSIIAPEVGESERWELRTDTGVNFPLGFGISANFSVEWAYVNHARDQNLNASLQDTIYRLGANYAW